MSLDANFPQISAPFVFPQSGLIQPAWRELLIALWQRTGGGTPVNAGQSNFWAGLAGGSPNAIVLNVASPEFTGYVDGQRFIFQALASNTAAALAHVNTQPDLPVRKGAAAPLVNADVLTARFYELVVADGSSAFQLNELNVFSPAEVISIILAADLGAQLILPTQIFGA